MSAVVGTQSDLLKYEGGDRNDPMSYSLRCGVGECSLTLGRLGQFTPDTEGRRVVSCPCGMCTVVDKDGQFISTVPKNIVEMTKMAKRVEGT